MKSQLRKVLPRAAVGAALAGGALLAAGGAGAGSFAQPVTVLAELHGDNPATGLGWAVSELRDVNGDGAEDVILAEPFTGFAGQGAAKVYSGRTGALLYRFDGASAGDALGYAIADAGDTNGDGVSDVLAGAPAPGFATPGSVNLYSGATGALLHTFVGVHSGDRFGLAVSSAGDVDGDGRADVLVGAPRADGGGRDSGRAYIYSGRTYALLRKLDAGRAGSAFGTGVDSTADVNHDGVPDEIVGARNYPGPGDGPGRAYVFSGATGRPLFTIDPPSTGVDLGWFFVAGVGDTNGDGIPDVYAADFDDASLGAAGTGRAAVYSGADGRELHAWTGGVPGEGLGPGREAGDVNHDGKVDLAIGSYTSDEGAPQAGKIQIFSGGDGSLLRTITSTTPGENFGFDVVGIGDVNRDGKPDFVVGAASLSNAYVVAGS
jgi:hypothetical protein